ncbi:MAG: universal stress protein [Sphingobacteriales bacterium]|uniref:universal stress protein n=1 Tax=Hydrotalea flava TaxID=714549 RepID=UPI0008338030|nr:universal stress protein [Hydrotalea flava]RTL53207.1 MAG: universal stress protein [Sphingobacteriales bacterium]
MEYKRILIAVDDSAYAIKAARAGFTLAQALEAVVGVVYVINKSKEIVSADLGITPEQSKTLLLQQADKTIQQYIELYDGKTEVFRFTPEGIPEKEILNIASEWEADLIVMGTHARSGLDRILTGSTAEYIIRHSTIPVLVTPPRMT